MRHEIDRAILIHRRFICSRNGSCILGYMFPFMKIWQGLVGTKACKTENEIVINNSFLHHSNTNMDEFMI